MIPGTSMHPHVGGGGAANGGQGGGHLPNQLSVVTTVNYGTHHPSQMGPNHNMDHSAQSQLMVS